MSHSTLSSLEYFACDVSTQGCLKFITYKIFRKMAQSKFSMNIIIMLASIRQMRGQVSRGSAGEYQADEITYHEKVFQNCRNILEKSIMIIPLRHNVFMS